MAHLSTCIVLSHARLKAEQRSVGESSLPKEVREADDYVNRVSDQIEMLQYVRGRIGEDRDTVLDICARLYPGHPDARVPTPVEAATSMQGPASGRDSPPFSPLSEDDDPGRQASKRSPEYSPVTDDDEHPELKRLKQHESDTTVTNSKSFTPLTPPIKVEAETGDLFMADVTARLTT